MAAAVAATAVDEDTDAANATVPPSHHRSSHHQHRTVAFASTVAGDEQHGQAHRRPPQHLHRPSQPPHASTVALSRRLRLDTSPALLRQIPSRPQATAYPALPPSSPPSHTPDPTAAATNALRRR
ncbi:hypothetical protein HK405_001302, partial [Cladochytrium tenue]